MADDRNASKWRTLYDHISDSYELPDYDEFYDDMTRNGETGYKNRVMLFNLIKDEYDVGANYEEFKKRIGLVANVAAGSAPKKGGDDGAEGAEKAVKPVAVPAPAVTKGGETSKGAERPANMIPAWDGDGGDKEDWGKTYGEFDGSSVTPKASKPDGGKGIPANRKAELMWELNKRANTPLTPAGGKPDGALLKSKDMKESVEETFDRGMEMAGEQGRINKAMEDMRLDIARNMYGEDNPDEKKVRDMTQMMVDELSFGGGRVDDSGELLSSDGRVIDGKGNVTDKIGAGLVPHRRGGSAVGMPEKDDSATGRYAKAHKLDEWVGGMSKAPEVSEEMLRTENRAQVNQLARDIDDALEKSRAKSVEKHTEAMRENPITYSLLHSNSDNVTGAAVNDVTSGYSADDQLEIQELGFARNAIKNARRLISEADYNAQKGTFGKWLESSFAGGAVRGFGQKLFDAETWDFGASDLGEALAVKRAAEAWDKGEPLSESQRMLLDAKAVELATNEYFGSLVGRGYNAGNVTAESILFMLEMLVNPLSAAGNTTASMLTRYALKRFGRQAVKANVKKFIASRVAAKALAQVGGSLGMAVTSGSMRSAADAVDRTTGDIKTEVDPTTLKTKYAGNEKGEDDVVSAIAKGIGNTAIENWSEMAGDYLKLGFLTKGLNKVASSRVGKALRLDKAKEFVDNVSVSDLAQMVSEFESEAQWHGVIGEYAEEVMGNMANALVIGDMTFDTSKESGVFNLDTNIDTFLGVGLMGGFMSTVKSAGYRSASSKARRGVEDGIKNCKAEFGEEWESLSAGLTSLDDDVRGRALAGILTGRYGNRAKQAAVTLAGRVSVLEGTVKGEQSRKADDVAAIIDNYATEEQKVRMAIDESFDRGYEEEGAETNSVTADLKKLAGEVLGDEDIDGALSWYDEQARYAGGFDGLAERHGERATELVKAVARYRGMLKAANDKADAADKLFDEDIDRIRHKDGSLRKVTLKDGLQVYVIGGGVIRSHEEADEENPGQTLTVYDMVEDEDNPTDVITVYDDKSKNRWQTKLDDVVSVDTYVDADALQQQVAQTKDEGRASMVERAVKGGNAAMEQEQGAEQGVEQGAEQGVEDTGNETGAGKVTGVKTVVNYGPGVVTLRGGERWQVTGEVVSEENMDDFDPRLVGSGDVGKYELYNPASGELKYMSAEELDEQSLGYEPERVEETSEDVDETEADTDTEQVDEVDTEAENVVETPAPATTDEQADTPTTEPSSATEPAPTALQRVPKNESGQPIFEAADHETAWDALVEYSDGDAVTAKEIADAMVEEKKKALDKAQKLKLKGKDPAEMLASKKANAAELSKAQQEFEQWQRIADEERRRKEAERQRVQAEQTEAAEEVVDDNQASEGGQQGSGELPASGEPTASGEELTERGAGTTDDSGEATERPAAVAGQSLQQSVETASAQSEEGGESFSGLSDAEKAERRKAIAERHEQVMLDLEDREPTIFNKQEALEDLNDLWQQMTAMYGESPADEEAARTVSSLEGDIRRLRLELLADAKAEAEADKVKQTPEYWEKRAGEVMEGLKKQYKAESDKAFAEYQEAHKKLMDARDKYLAKKGLDISSMTAEEKAATEKAFLRSAKNRSLLQAYAESEAAYREAERALENVEAEVLDDMNGELLEYVYNKPELEDEVYLKLRGGIEDGLKAADKTQKDMSGRKHDISGEQGAGEAAQKAPGSVDAAGMVAEHFGRTVVYDGDFSGENHRGYVDSDNVIHLNPAMSNAEQLGFVLGHEIMHTTEGTKEYQELIDFVKQSSVFKGWLGDKTLMQAVAEKKALYKAHGVELTDEGAEAEVMADFFGSEFLSNPEVACRLVSESPVETRSFLERLIDSIKEMLRKVGDVLRGKELTETERDEFDRTEEELKRIEALLKSALDVDMVKKAEGVVQNSIDTYGEALGVRFSKTEAGETIFTRADGSRMTECTVDDIKQSALGSLIGEAIRSGRITAEEGEKQSEFFAGLTDMMIKTKDIDMVYAVSSQVILMDINQAYANAEIKNKANRMQGKKTIEEVARDYDAKGLQPFAGLTSNSDPQYSRTIDWTTICVKTQSIIDAMSGTMKKMKRGLTADEIVEIVYSVVHEAGEPVPCPVCYVFSRWINLGKRFDTMNELQERYGLPENLTPEEQEAHTESVITHYRHVVEEAQELARENNVEGKSLDDKIKALNKSIEAEILALRQKQMEKMFNKKKSGLTKTEQTRLIELEEQKRTIDEYSWFWRVRLDISEDGEIKSKQGYKDISTDVLYDINASTRFATEYPLQWGYRCAGGSGMGKAAYSYAPLHLGQIITGTANMDNVKNLDKNPFLTPSDEVDENGYRLLSEEGRETMYGSGNSRGAVQKALIQNWLNGQRLQSTSDFRFEFGLDYLMAQLEQQAIGATQQMYMKVPEGTPFMATTGAEVNVSIMGQGKGYKNATFETYMENGEKKTRITGGELVFSTTTGADANDAFDLARHYDNVQPILVGFNPEHTRLAMRDGRITFIIPYHASGLADKRYDAMLKIVGELTQQGNVFDFTGYQSDVSFLGVSAQKALTDEAWERHVVSKLSKFMPQFLTDKSGKPLTREQLLERMKACSELRKAILSDKRKPKAGVKENAGEFYMEDSYDELSREIKDLMEVNPYLRTLYDKIRGDKNSEFYGVKLTGDQQHLIMSHEYWDQSTTYDQDDYGTEKDTGNDRVNGDRFVAYSLSLGSFPRFSGWNSEMKYDERVDFTDEQGYWKTLIDRSMYNTAENSESRGRYHEQAPVRLTTLGETSSQGGLRGIDLIGVREDEQGNRKTARELMREEMNARRAEGERGTITKLPTTDSEKKRRIVEEIIKRVETSRQQKVDEAKRVLQYFYNVYKEKTKGITASDVKFAGRRLHNLEKVVEKYANGEKVYVSDYADMVDALEEMLAHIAVPNEREAVVNDGKPGCREDYEAMYDRATRTLDNIINYVSEMSAGHQFVPASVINRISKLKAERDQIFEEMKGDAKYGLLSVPTAKRITKLLKDVCGADMGSGKTTGKSLAENFGERVGRTFDVAEKDKSGRQMVSEVDRRLGRVLGEIMRDAGMRVVMDAARMRQALDVAEVSVMEFAKNNRKLLEPTYDKNGNLIPLSKRFDLRTAGTEFLRTRQGEVYGFVKDGVIYLDPEVMNPNTPVHEYTHLWDKALQVANPELWARGKELMKRLPLWDEVRNDPNYADIADDEDLLASEVHSRLAGAEGERYLNEMVEGAKGSGDYVEIAKTAGLKERVKAWLREALAWVRDAFSGKWGEKELGSLTIDEFAKMPLKDLVSGVNPVDVAAEHGTDIRGGVAERMPMEMFIGKRARAEYEAMLDKKQPDMPAEWKKEALDYLHSLEDTKDNSRKVKVAVNWMSKGKIRLPQDIEIVEKALALADKKHIDATRYASPADLLLDNTVLVKSDEILDPDTMEAFSNKRVDPETGCVVYDVEDSERGQQAVIDILISHMGRDEKGKPIGSPWCLSTFTAAGEATESAQRYWKHYGATSKQIAFKDGKVFAFSANSNPKRVWWDFYDERGMRLSECQTRPESYGQAMRIEEYTQNGVTSKVAILEDGRKQLIERTTVTDSGRTEEVYRLDGQLKQKASYDKENRLQGVSEYYHENGQLSMREEYKDGERNGVCELYYLNGQLSMREEYKDGERNGVCESYYDNGQLCDRTEYKDGKLHGVREVYDVKGQFKSRAELKDGKLHGVYESYYNNGQLKEREEFKDGERNGVREVYDVNGQLSGRVLCENDKVVEADYRGPRTMEAGWERGADGGLSYRTVGGNKGYVGYSMSKRAADARADGRYPKTDFKKEYGMNDATLEFLTLMGVIDNSEWHHTSKYGNKTTFYGWDVEGGAGVYASHKGEISGMAAEYKGMMDVSRASIEALRDAESALIRYLRENYDGWARRADEIIAGDAQAAELAAARDTASQRVMSEADVKREMQKMYGERLSEIFSEDGGMTEQPADASVEGKRRQAESMSERLNTPVRIVENVEDITDADPVRQAKMRKAKGWYDKRTGEVVINLSRNRNTGDIAETMLHEVVAHKGLRELVGEEGYRDFLRDVFEHCRADVKKKIAEKAQRNGWDFEKATDEYLGELAEKGFEDFTEGERSIWQKLKAKVLEAINRLLRGAGLPKWVKLGDNELRYMLWRSHENLRSRGNDYVSELRDVAKREELGLSDDLLFRDSSGESDDIWKDMSLGFEERITNASLRLSNNQSGDLRLRGEAMRAVCDNLQTLLHDMRNRSGRTKSFKGADEKVEREVERAAKAQRIYDRVTVKRVADLARVLMRYGYLNEMTSGEMQRIVSALKNVTGTEDIANSVEKIMDIMIDNQLRGGGAALKSLLSIRGSKVDARGVEVQGALDADGAKMLQSMRRGMKLSEDDLIKKIDEAQERMGDSDRVIADEAALEYAGLQMALEYVRDITASKNEEKDLRESMRQAKAEKDAGRMTADRYDQFIEAVEDAIRKNKIERAEAYNALVGRLSDSMRQSIENAKEWREAEKRRIQEIQHNANSDMQGMESEMHRGKESLRDKASNFMAATVFSPLSSYEQMVRSICGRKAADGEGYIYNRFVRGLNDARAKEISGYRGKQKILDAKVRELFRVGKGKAKSMGGLIRLERNLPKMTVRYFDKSANEYREAELTQGNLLYIYMVDKMSDGRMKLRNMGISESDVEAISEFLDPRIKAFGDWIQNEFLVQTRNEYNETHKRMFGTSMAAIDDYFPLKVLGDARGIKEDIDTQDTVDGSTTTITGAIKKRRVNTLALDILGADAFNVLLDHISEMEHWNAYAELGRDMSTLLSYGKFRNRVKNMRTIYGAGEQLWKRFKNVSRIAFGTYHQEVDDFNKGFLKLARGVTAAKVAFRFNTALKQILSLPALIPDISISGLIERIKNPHSSFIWCMENLPVFKERWGSRISGDPRLMKSERGWQDWRKNVAEIAGRWGMTANAFIDAITCSLVARTIYDTRLAQYIKDGYPIEHAEAKAKQDASIGFNLSQQSNESAYLAPIQVNKNWLNVMFTIFRNSPISYTRQVVDSVRDMNRNLTPGKRDEKIDFMTKQTLRERGIDPDSATDKERAKAKKVAKRRYSRALRRDALRLLTYGFILPGLWSLGGYWLYMLLGNDDDDKEQMEDDIIARLSTAPFEGLAGGDIMSNVSAGFITGEWNDGMLEKDMPISHDIAQIVKKLFNEDKTADGINDIFNLCVQSGFGFNPATIENAVLGILDASGNDVELANEGTIIAARILNCPESQVKKLYFDEIGMSGEEASKLSPAEIAERYARMQVKLGRPLFKWLWNDEALIDKRMNGRYGTLATAKERFERQGDPEVREAYAGYAERYAAIDERVKAAKKLAKSDYASAAQEWAGIQDDEDFKMYQEFGALDKYLTKLSGMWIKSESGDEAQVISGAINDYRESMVKFLGATEESERESAKEELQGVVQQFSEDYEPYKPEDK